MSFLKKLIPQSRKLIVFVVALVAYGANMYFGKPVSDADLTSMLALVVGWLVSQGIADHGAQGAAIAQKRAKAAAETVAELAGFGDDDDSEEESEEK